MIVPRDPDEAARLRSERNQGRAVDMGWLDHDRLGFNYRLSDLAAALGVAQVEKLDSLLGRRAEVARMYEERLAATEGFDSHCAGSGKQVQPQRTFERRGISSSEHIKQSFAQPV